MRTYDLNRTVRRRQRQTTVGSADAMTMPQARADARRLLASYIESARNDDGPRTPGRAMDAATECLECYTRHWKPRTLANSA